MLQGSNFLKKISKYDLNIFQLYFLDNSQNLLLKKNNLYLGNLTEKNVRVEL